MDEKKLEILERATAVYMKYGIKSVTMDDLAKELGISKKTIYKYFSDKNNLIEAIIELKIEMDKAICLNCRQQSINAVDHLIQISQLLVEQVGSVNPTVFYDLNRFHKSAWILFNKHKWEFVLDIITENIERGIKEGFYRSDLKVDVCARLYVSSTETILNDEIFPWPEYTFDSVLPTMVSFHLHGMVNEKGRKYLLDHIKSL